MENKYLGDGVYASFDGYHINLAVNNHKNHAVALEPAVMRELIKYYEYILYKQQNKEL